MSKLLTPDNFYEQWKEYRKTFYNPEKETIQYQNNVKVQKDLSQKDFSLLEDEIYEILNSLRSIFEKYQNPFLKMTNIRSCQNDEIILKIYLHIYNDEFRSSLKDQFNYKNELMIPRLEKVVLNMGIGEAVADTKKVKSAHNDLMLIAGQLPVFTKAKKSIAGFKVREGMQLGAKVTLRRSRMYEFIDRLINVAMPRIRDFRGLSPKSFDGRGNYALGIKEHIVFPEIDFDKVDEIWGLDVVVCTTARSNDEAKFLLGLFNFPFRD